MAIADTNSILKEYLDTRTTLTDLVKAAGESARIYCPRLPENATLPAVGFFVRGGTSTPYIPGIISPSVQFDCWAASPIVARQVYRALYDNLQGIQNVKVGSYYIMSAIEEVQGQDLADEIPGYFRVLTFFSVMIRAE
ncbi:MAG TPA: hypothetical protein VMV84_05230 [Dehalococcoidales bacterium]|nr:hypothetical protein [Dehalococcoidales bacterium]